MRLKTLIASLVISTSLAAQNTSKWIRFDWHGETIYGKYYPKVAMSIPLKIERLPYNFCGQFDMGATSTIIYENAFKAFAKQDSSVVQKLDTTISPYYFNGRKSFYLKGLNIQLDKTPFNNRNIAFIPNFGDEIPADSIHTPSQKLIGTIAPDLFQGKILIIDFVHNRIMAVDQLPKQYAKANFVKAIIRKGRVKIPFVMGDSTHYVMFDTGNCLGDLLLDKETINLFTKASDTAEVFLNGKQWGEEIILYAKSLTSPVLFNSKDLHIKQAIFSNQDIDVQFNKEEKIIGLIGPVLFSNNVVIIDYKTNRFGVL